MRNEFREGLKAGIPIALGYVSVSFSIGLMAASVGMNVLEAAVFSAANVTSAGEAAGIRIIAAGGSLLEMALTQLVINLRYALMALSLTQKLNPEFHTPQRLIVSYGITDEIFGVSSAREGKLSPSFMYGIILISVSFWVLGTVLGAAAGKILPESVTSALGIMLYGMFLAIILPQAKKDRHVLLAIAVSAALSTLVYFEFPRITSGFSVIICSILAAVIASVIHPIGDETEDDL